MKTRVIPLVIGNWKMNPATYGGSQSLATSLKKKLKNISEVTIGIAPPNLYLEGVSKVRGGSSIFELGVQNVHHENIGAYTGETGIAMVRSYGVSFCIIGHSERRALGETDESINKKILALLKDSCVAVVCVGEGVRDHNGQYLSLIEKQIRSALQGVTKAKLSYVVIAYEPIWAIGTNNTATADDVHEMRLFIEKIVSDIYGRNLAQKVRIIYGGSVNPKNARDLFVLGTVDGFLVGGASLHAEDFVSIVKATM